jgi:hypothetical protein
VLVEGRYGKEEASFSFSCQRGKAVQRKIVIQGTRPFVASYKNWLVKLPEKDYRQHPSLLASLSCDTGWAIHIYPFSKECFN